MTDTPLFHDADEQERVFAPQQVPGERVRARLEGDLDDTDTSAASEPPMAAPVANMGNAPSAAAAPPNIGHGDQGGAPGDPQTQARDPFKHNSDRDLHERE